MGKLTPVITIDGPSGTGKGTLCLRLADALGWNVLDSGALYRVLALAAQQHAVASDNEEALTVLAGHLDVQFISSVSPIGVRTILEGADATDDIRTEVCGNIASQIAQYKTVRQALLDRQRAFAQPPGLVTDGRDMGTVVFPEAFLKLYLDADVKIRAQRRFNQLKEKGINANLAQVVEELTNRDVRDKARETAPLRAAEQAVLIDTSEMSADQVFDKVMQLVAARAKQAEPA